MSSNELKIDPETQEMLASFVSEAVDSLDSNEDLVEFLRETDNSDQVNAIFRVFHTLKGLSGFFEMKIINNVTHEAETLLDIIRKQNVPQSEDTITVIYQTFDLLRDLLQSVSTEFTDQGGAEAAEDMVIIIKDAIAKAKGESGEAGPQPPAEAPAPVEEPAGDAGGFPDIPAELLAEFGGEEIAPEPAPAPAPVQEAPAPAPAADAFDMSSLISDEMLEQYLTSAADLIESIEKNLFDLEKDPKNTGLIAETFGAVHSVKGNSGFMGFSEIEEIAMDMETVLDAVRSNALDLDSNIVTILLSNTETIQKRLDSIAANNKNAAAEEEPAPAPVAAPAPAPTPTPAPVAATPAPAPASAPKVEAPAPEPASAPKPAPAPVAEAPKPAPAAPKKPNVPAGLSAPQKKEIRVDATKIDKLFALVGELITIESMVTNSPDLAGLELTTFSKSANMLNKICRELQETAMSIRMMPLEGTFNKMKRLVRDVSIKMNKKIELQIFGSQTEMDKNVIDEIGDPLMHIMRNSIDHGIEAPEVRVEKGKTEYGTVTLGARYEGNEILIIVEDDGNGINRDAVLRKAEEKGLLKVPPEQISDKEVFAMIFEPGFSTAKEVTDISGRGVGMDVVRKNIEKLRGTIDVSSTMGKGSKFTLRIPLTLAIIESMVIRIGDSLYALPILSLRESIRPSADMVNITMDGLEVVNVRQEILPIIRLHEEFQIEDSLTNINEGILLIVESKDNKVCLFADEIVGQQQAVVKGLSSYIGKVPGITGCMVTSDGSIGLILDIDGLIEMAQKKI